MFEWESKMNSDLAPLFDSKIQKNISTLPNKNDNAFASTTTQVENTTEIIPATTTITYPKQNEIKEFEDVVVSNIETRELRNEKDEPIILWAMPNETTIVITTSEKTMRVLVERVIVSS